MQRIFAFLLTNACKGYVVGISYEAIDSCLNLTSIVLNFCNFLDSKARKLFSTFVCFALSAYELGIEICHPFLCRHSAALASASA